jgi:hypothetical protein
MSTSSLIVTYSKFNPELRVSIGSIVFEPAVSLLVPACSTTTITISNTKGPVKAVCPGASYTVEVSTTTDEKKHDTDANQNTF